MILFFNEKFQLVERQAHDMMFPSGLPTLYCELTES